MYGDMFPVLRALQVYQRRTDKKIVMENSGGDSRRYRQNLQGLLRFAVEHHDDPQSDTSSVFQEMTEEVICWLRLAAAPESLV